MVEQFESEIVRELRRYGDRMVAENPEPFEAGVKGSQNVSSSSGSLLGYARLDYRMDRVRGPENESTQKLNIHLYWARPEQYNRPDIDGALRGVGYKIKNADSEKEEHLKAQTRDWDLCVCVGDAANHARRDPDIPSVYKSTSLDVGNDLFASGKRR